MKPYLRNAERRSRNARGSYGVQRYTRRYFQARMHALALADVEREPFRALFLRWLDEPEATQRAALARRRIEAFAAELGVTVHFKLYPSRSRFSAWINVLFERVSPRKVFDYIGPMVLEARGPMNVETKRVTQEAKRYCVSQTFDRPDSLEGAWLRGALAEVRRHFENAKQHDQYSGGMNFKQGPKRIDF